MPKSRTSKKAPLTANRKKWWVIGLAAVIVGIVGLVIIRLSQASNTPHILMNEFGGHNYGAGAMREGNIQHLFWCGVNIYTNSQGQPSPEEVIYYQTKNTLTGQTSKAYPTINSRLKSGKWENGSHMCDPTIVKGNFSYKGQNYKYALYYGSDPDHSSRRTKIGVAFTNSLSSDPNYPTNWTFVDHPIICEYGANKDHYGVGITSVIVDPVDPSKVKLFFVDTSHTATSLPDFKRFETFAVEGNNGYDFGWNGNCVLSSNAPKPQKVNATGLEKNIAGADIAYDKENGWYYMIFSDTDALRQPIYGPGDKQGEGFYSETYQQILARIKAEAVFDPTKGKWQIIGRINSDTTKSSLNHNPSLEKNESGGLDGITALIRGIRELRIWNSQVIPDELVENPFANADLGLTTSNIERSKIKEILWKPGVIAVNRYYNPETGEHTSTTGPQPKTGYHFDNQTFYLEQDPAGRPGWQPVYSCVSSGLYDYFLSTDQNCNGFTSLGLIGYSYKGENPPEAFANNAFKGSGTNSGSRGQWAKLYRCWSVNGQGVGQNFMTIDGNCEGWGKPADESYGWVLTRSE